jgi:hypothetical protein
VLEKIAAYTTVADEQLEDEPGLRLVLTSELGNELMDVLDRELVLATGVAPKFMGFIPRSAGPDHAVTAGESPVAAILAEAGRFYDASGVLPDSVVTNYKKAVACGSVTAAGSGVFLQGRPSWSAQHPRGRAGSGWRSRRRCRTGRLWSATSRGPPSSSSSAASGWTPRTRARMDSAKLDCGGRRDPRGALFAQAARVRARDRVATDDAIAQSARRGANALFPRGHRPVNRPYSNAKNHPTTHSNQLQNECEPSPVPGKSASA